MSVVGSYLTLPQLNSHFLLPVTLFMLKLRVLMRRCILSLQESYCLPVLTYAVAALSLSVRQENELNACWNSVYRKLFGFHKWESVKYCIYGLNRLDLHSTIRFRRASFYRYIMLSASPLLCNIFWCFLTDSQANDDVLSVFRLYSDVVVDIRHVFIVHACS